MKIFLYQHADFPKILVGHVKIPSNPTVGCSAESFCLALGCWNAWRGVLDGMPSGVTLPWSDMVRAHQGTTVQSQATGACSRGPFSDPLLFFVE